MRIRITALLLGTAAMGAWAQTERGVTVDYTHLGPVRDQSAQRFGDRTFVSPTTVRKLGWAIELRSETAYVTAEGRTFTLDVRAIGGQPFVCLEDGLRFLGGASEWDSDANTLRVLGTLRNLEATPGGVRIDATMAVAARAYRMADPERLVIDVEGARLSQRFPESLPPGWRAGQFQPDVVRLVFESPLVATLAVPNLGKGRRFEFALPKAEAIKVATIGKPELESRDDNGATFRVAITGPLKSKPFAVFLDPRTVQVSFPSARIDGGHQVRNPAPGVEMLDLEDSGDGRVTLVATLAHPMAFDLASDVRGATLRLRRPSFTGIGLAGRVIVIDPGHGGKDGGATTAGVREKDLALSTGKIVAKALAERGASVILTRDSDEFVALSERPAIANRSKADAFISVHFNSNTIADSRSGTITFYHKQDSMDMLLAACLNEQIAEVSGLPDLGLWSDQRIYRSGFAVLRSATMPSVLLELGFVNHATDRARAREEQFQAAIGEAVAKGLEVFFGGR